MLGTVKRSVKTGIAFALEGAVALSSAVGAPIAIVFGKLFLAAILGALALGIFLRFAGRKVQPVSVPMPTPWWAFPCSALLSLIETAALVEATNLPVRFDQPGFDKSNWLLVLLALAVAFAFQLMLFKRVGRRTSRTTVLTNPSSGPSSAAAEVKRR